MSEFLTGLRARAARPARRIVFPESHDQRTLQAVATLQREGLARCVLVGGASALAALRAAGGKREGIELHSPLDSTLWPGLVEHLLARRGARGLTRAQAEEVLTDPLIFAAALVGMGAADGCVAGAGRPTSDVIRAALWCIGTEPGIATVSSAFYMVVRPFRSPHAEVLTFTDAGVVPEPSAEQLVEIAAAAARARRQIVGDRPRVAFLSYSTLGSADGPAVHKVRAAVRQFQARFPDIAAAGEVQADAALIPQVAARKAPDGSLAGDANVLVFPSLDAGNIAYKLVQRLGEAQAIGPILQGLARPANDLSRGATVDDIVNVACVTALQVTPPAPNLPLRES
jgi:phosphate acetyltransferase